MILLPIILKHSKQEFLLTPAGRELERRVKRKKKTGVFLIREDDSINWERDIDSIIKKLSN